MEISAQRHIHVIYKRTWGTKPIYNKHIIGERMGVGRNICRKVVARGAPRTEIRLLARGGGGEMRGREI